MKSNFKMATSLLWKVLMKPKAKVELKDRNPDL